MSERTSGERIPHNDRRPFTPRKALALPREMYSEEGRAFFLTTRALWGTRPFATPERCRIVLEQLAAQRSALGCWVGAYCLMPDHLHFVSGPGPTGRSVLDLLRRLHGASTNALWKTGWKGKVWQPRGYDRLIDGQRDLEEISAYILQNPVRAGLVEAAEDWPWAGLMDDPFDAAPPGPNA
jgi:REP element-mobilizing transposase RayT